MAPVTGGKAGIAAGVVGLAALLLLAQSFDLSVAGISPSGGIAVGTPVTFNVAVSIPGGATGVTVTAIFRPAVTFNTDGSTTGCAANTGGGDPSTTVICQGISSSPVSINVTPLQGGSLTVVAGIIGNQSDSFLANNSRSVPFSVGGGSTPVPTPITPVATPTPPPPTPTGITALPTATNTPGPSPTPTPDNTITLFPPPVTPTGQVFVGSIEVGELFRTTQEGAVVGLRFWRSSSETGAHVMTLWGLSGNLLARVSLAAGAPGWQEQSLTQPVFLTANQYCWVSYTVNSWTGATPDALYGGCHFGIPITNGPLNTYCAATTGPGQFPGAIPQTDTNNYFADIRFQPGLVPTSTPTIAPPPTRTPLPRPRVDSIVPTSGSTAGGTQVTVNGANFSVGANWPSVALGGAPVTVTSVTAGQLVGTTSARSAGTVDVVVTNPDGQFGTLPQGFTYVSPTAVPSSTFTSTPVTPTRTPTGPAATATRTSTRTNTQTSTRTSTPTSTPTRTYTPSRTNTPSRTPTKTRTPTPTPPPAVNAATFVSQSVPASVVAGATFSATVTMKNTGTTTWTGPGGYRLRSLVTGDPWGSRVNLASGVSILPGQQKSFAISAVVPQASGTYPFQWRMEQEGMDFSGTPSPLTQIIVTAAPLQAYSVLPCRVVDTRNAAGTYGGPALAAFGTRLFPMRGVCGVPSTARAVMISLAVLAPTADGFLVIYPPNMARPGISSVNYRAGALRSNNAIVTLDSTGQMAVYANQANGTAHFVVDVTGYLQ